MSSTELENKVRELRQLQNLIEEAEEQAETIKDAIKAQIGQEEVLRAGEYTITYKTVKSARIDAKALKEALPSVAARFMVETIVRRFCVA